jgi:hypothetical protein
VVHGALLKSAEDEGRGSRCRLSHGHQALISQTTIGQNPQGSHEKQDLGCNHLPSEKLGNDQPGDSSTLGIVSGVCSRSSNPTELSD